MKKIKVFFYYLIWVIIQIFLLSILEKFKLEPGDFIGKPRAGMATFEYDFTRDLAILIYTFIGIKILLKHGINTRQWWKKISVWYLVYAIICSAGMLWVMQAWFWEGFGLYLVDVLYLPLLWLLELELCQLLNLGLRFSFQKRPETFQ